MFALALVLFKSHKVWIIVMSVYISIEWTDQTMKPGTSELKEWRGGGATETEET